MIPSDAFGHVTFAVTDTGIATVNPASAVGPVQALIVNGVKKGTTFLEAFVGCAPCGKAAIAVGQMIVVRITPDPAYFAPGKRVTFTAVAFAPVQGCALIPKEYSPDLSTPVGAEVAVGEAKGIYLGPTPATWRLEGQGNKAAKALIPPDVPTQGVSSVQVEARPDAVGEIKPELSAYGCNEDCARGVVVAIEKIRYRRSGGAWKDAPEWLYVSKGETMEFMAVQEPADAPWPANEPNWGGMASGTGSTATVAFDVVGRGTVSVSCGASSKLVYVAAVEVELSVVNSRVWFAAEKLRVKGRVLAPEGETVPLNYTAVGNNIIDKLSLEPASGTQVLTNQEQEFVFTPTYTDDGNKAHATVTFDAAGVKAVVALVGFVGFQVTPEPGGGRTLKVGVEYSFRPVLSHPGEWPTPPETWADGWVEPKGSATVDPAFGDKLGPNPVHKVTPQPGFVSLHIQWFAGGGVSNVENYWGGE